LAAAVLVVKAESRPLVDRWRGKAAKAATRCLALILLPAAVAVLLAQ